MVDRVGYAPTTSRMSSEHSTIELTVPKFINTIYGLLIKINLLNF